MPQSGKILQLRALIERHLSAPPRRTGALWETGVTHLDQLLGGGLGQGGITEVVCPFPSSGGSSLLIALLRQSASQGRWSALIDGSDSFDPASAGAGLLASLLWIRCRQAADALRSADLLLRDGNLPLVVLDLHGNSPDELRRIPAPHWYRLQRTVEPTAIAFLVLTPHSMIPCPRVRIALQSAFDLQALECEFAALLDALQFEITRRHSTQERHLLAEAV